MTVLSSDIDETVVTSSLRKKRAASPSSFDHSARGVSALPMALPETTIGLISGIIGGIVLGVILLLTLSRWWPQHREECIDDGEEQDSFTCLPDGAFQIVRTSVATTVDSFSTVETVDSQRATAMTGSWASVGVRIV